MIALLILLLGQSMGTRGSVATDAQELELYLSTPEIHAMLQEQLEPFKDCYTYSSANGRVMVGEVHVLFDIAPDGHAGDARVHVSKSGLDDLDQCLVERANQLEFRPHNEEPVSVGYPFVFMNGSLQPYPMVFVKQRSMGLLWLYLPQDLALEARLLGAEPGD